MVVALILIAGGTPLHGEYMVPEIEQVPVVRLIANFERRLTALGASAEPDQRLELQAQLARVHALAYAQDRRELQVVKDGGAPFEGPGWVPAIPLPITGEALARGPQSYLARALELYAEVLAARPYDDSRLRLGYAWCLEESGETAGAVENYRAVVAAAWSREQGIKSLEYGERTLTQEAALRLIDLLDPEKDAAEIAALERRNAHFDQVGRWITPLVIPLNEGLALDNLLDRDAAVAFDLDGSGMARKWRWITPHAAWLVWDPAGKGEITSGLQLFGSVTFWLFWDNGYQALAALDDDGDGRLAGAELRGLALWRDGNGDGLSGPGEVRPLADWGIAALATDPERHPAGFPYNPEGVLLGDGRTRPSYDWILPAAPAPAY